MLTRPTIGISACLAGERVRYDGNDKFHHLVADHVAPFVDMIPFCPEVEAGLGIPRPPIQLVQTADAIRLRRVNQPTHDVTERVRNASMHFCSTNPQLDGYILKSRSPSCGLQHVPVAIDGTVLEKGRGLFADYLVRNFPGLVVIEENALNSKKTCEEFLQALNQAASHDGH